jgi:cation diffusion facilitator family transporter
MMPSIRTALRASGISIAVNALLAGAKVAAGLLGNSYALIADGIESMSDILSSFIVWSGLRISSIPPDQNHPYGHGKAESIAGAVVSVMLLAASLLIAVQSIREIVTPHHAPAWFTLPILGLVIVIKETLSRFVLKVGESIDSTSVKGDAWHHRSDAITSAAAFVGISIALIGGKGYESADDWAALAACLVIAFNGVRLLRPALNEIMDAAVAEDLVVAIVATAEKVPGVVRVEECRVRKSGLGILIDIHVEVAENKTVREGHDIAHQVRDHLMAANLRIRDVLVHIEPAAKSEIIDRGESLEL